LRWAAALRDLQIHLEARVSRSEEEVSQRVGSWFYAELDCSQCTSTIKPQQKMKTMMTTLRTVNLTSQSCLRRGFLLIPLGLALAWFALSPASLGQLSPAPDGGYPNGNTAEGDDALFSLTTGSWNTANGYQSLYSNTTGDANTAIGYIALSSNTTGQGNTATGYQTLIANTAGDRNTANGIDALFSNTTGSFNTANGGSALASNTTGGSNTASGNNALINNTTGNSNTAAGLYALQSNTTGSNNIALGSFAGTNRTTGDNNIDIGNGGVAAEADSIRIGTTGTQTNAYIAGIYQTTVARGVTVVVDSTGHLGTRGSSERFKDAIKPIDKASEAILALKPVSFRYKKEIDPDHTPQFGLVAEDVEKVNRDLVVRDADDKAYTVRYEAVNAMLLNEFLKSHRKIEDQKKEIDALKAELKAQRGLIQKVSDKLNLNQHALKKVVINQ
jgi:hypothetical protein